MNPNEKSSVTSAIAPAPPVTETAWDDLLKQLGVSSANDPALQSAVDTIEMRDPERVLEGHRRQGQGQ